MDRENCPSFPGSGNGVNGGSGSGRGSGSGGSDRDDGSGSGDAVPEKVRAGGDAPCGRLGIIWLGTNTCDGHIISFLNSDSPSLRQLLEEDFDIYYNSMIMAAEGERAAASWEHPALRGGEFIFVVEGTVSTAMGGQMSIMAEVKGRPVTALELVRRLGAEARWVVAVGTCSSFGGPYAAHPNVTGSLSLSDVLERPVINVPGCPVNPGWIVETLRQIKAAGRVELDSMGRPRFLYGSTVHSHCERLPLYRESNFATHPGQEGCTYLLGCKGPVTRADCPQRMWISRKSGWPVSVNSPCIGCTAPEFPDQVAPFFEHLSDLYAGPVRVNLKTAGLAAGVMALLGISAHLAGNVKSGRLLQGSLRSSLQGSLRGLLQGSLRGSLQRPLRGLLQHPLQGLAQGPLRGPLQEAAARKWSRVKKLLKQGAFHIFRP